MMGAYLLAAVAASSMGELETFKDWIVGCDNGLVCQASAMMPPTGGGVTLTVRRGPGGAAVPEVWLRAWEGEAADLQADGRRQGLRLRKNEDEAYVVDRADAVRLLDTLRAAKSVTVVDAAGKAIEDVSADGASAALLYMDEKQRRLGTVGALVRRGAKPNSTVPLAPRLPVVFAVKGSAKPPSRLPDAFIARVRKDNDCSDETEPDLVSHDRLDDRHTLAKITLLCVSGAYNYISETYIMPDGGTPREAAFDDEGEEGDMHGYNLHWSAEERRLHAGFKTRGIGDCGGRQKYAWDGRRFRLVEVSGMDDCRGVTDFITLWRARVVER